MGKPTGRSWLYAGNHGAGIGAMSGHLAAVSQAEIGQKALVTFEEYRFGQRAGPLHEAVKS
jgi:hypothetical protein